MGFPTVTVIKEYHPYFYLGIRKEDFTKNKLELLESHLMLNRWCEEEYLKEAFSKSANGERAERCLRNLIRDELDKTYKTLAEKDSGTRFNILNGSAYIRFEKMIDVTPRSWLTVVLVEFEDCRHNIHKKNTESYGKMTGKELAIRMVAIDYEFDIDRELPYEHKYQQWVDLAPIARAINCLPGIKEEIRPGVFCGEIVRAWLNGGNQTIIASLQKRIIIEGGFTGHHLNEQLFKENVVKSYLDRGGSKIQFQVDGGTLDYGEPPLAPVFRIELRPLKGYDWISNDIECAANLLASHLKLNRE